MPGHCAPCAVLWLVTGGGGFARSAGRNTGPPTGSRPLAENVPTWEDIAAAPILTKAYVPQGAKRLWAQCVASAVNQIIVYGDDKAWREWYMLPKAVLRSADRGGGKKGKHKAESETRARAKAWLEGQRAELWSPPRQAKGRPETREWGDTQRRARAVELAKEGLLGKACASLVAEPPVQVNEEVLNQMRSKHPPSRTGEGIRCRGLREVCSSMAVKVMEDSVLKAIRSFPKGSAPGPSGLRPQHLKDALAPGWADEVVRELTKLVNKMAQGEIPSKAAEHVMGASLTALSKPGGKGLRPVAVGETIRRCAAKTLWESVRVDVIAHLEPIQMGVGTPMGAEAVVHLTRDWLLGES